MAFSNEPLSPPRAEDFQRMGLRRMEFRPPVIRRAIIRSAQPLVLMHLRSPSDEVERMLVNVMLSGYRVLDPRRRDDSNQRVMLGRIHPQLVEEAVSLAQQKSTPAATGASTTAPAVIHPAHQRGVTAAVEQATAADVLVAGDVGLVPSEGRVAMDFSPIAERDWLEPASGAWLSTERTPLGSGFPETSTSDRFLDVAPSAAWASRLTGADLMIQPKRLRVSRAVRRRVAKTSVISRVAAAMLAASVVLIATWRSTVWVRSWGDRPASVELAEPAISPEELARIAARSLPAVDADTGEPQGAAVAKVTQPAADGQIKQGQLEQDELQRPVAGGRVAERSGETAGEAVPEPVSSVELVHAAMPVSTAEVENSVERSSLTGDAAVAALTPEKRAEDERIGMELLGLIEPAGVVPGKEPVAEIERPELPEPGLLNSARLRVESAARAIRVAQGGSPLVGQAAAASGVAVFRRVAMESPAGSPERWVATLLAGQTAALAGSRGDANRSIDELTQAFRIDREQAMLRLARWMAADLVSSDDLRAVATWIDGQLRASMLAGELETAGELVGLIQEMGLKHRDDTLRAEAKLWRDVLIIAQRYADALARVEAVAAGSASADDHGLAGRYWAQVRRDWVAALPHFAACSTPKFSKLAGMELFSGAAIDAEDAVTLADGYLAEAKRAKGWLGESFALHSHELLVTAAETSERAVAVELKRRASTIQADYPRAFFAADDRVATAADAPSAGPQPGDSPPVGENAAAADDSAAINGAARAVPEMLGRLRFGGQDGAVLVAYQMGMPLSKPLVGRIGAELEKAGGLSLAESAGRDVEFEFVGEVSLASRQTVAFYLDPSQLGGSQSLSINGRVLVAESMGTIRSPQRIEVDLGRGDYVVRWGVKLVDGDRVALRAIDEASGKLVPMVVPTGSIADHPGALPTRLRVNVLAAD